MTQEEKALLVGRVILELQEAEAELSQLLVRAEQYAQDIGKLATAITKRIERAKVAGTLLEVSGPSASISDFPTIIRRDSAIENLRRFAPAVDLDAIAKLDAEIAGAVDRAVRLRQQRQQLGV